MAAENHTDRLPDELVWEILKWVPVKSLMRFKCVSRIWFSIIVDPSFASAHRGRGGCRGLLVPTDPMLRFPSPRLAEKRYFFYVNIDDDDDDNRRQVVSPRLTVNHGVGNRMGFTQLVNGLICFYTRNYSYLFNFATRETRHLPLSNNDSQVCSYHFGFDPVNKLYKLLKICPVYDNYDEVRDWDRGAVFVRYLNCEVLTIGVDSSWRIIDPRPPLEIETSCRSVCMGGVLYWMVPVRGSPYEEKRLISFHLVQEKFEIIPFPGPTRDSCLFYLPNFGLSLVVFSLALLFESDTDMGMGTVEVLMVRRDEERGVWLDDQKFILPTFVSDRDEDETTLLRPGVILANGKMLIFDDEDNYTLYLYDHSKRDLGKKIVVRLGPPTSSKYRDDLLHLEDSFYLEENIIPLTNLV